MKKEISIPLFKKSGKKTLKFFIRFYFVSAFNFNINIILYSEFMASAYTEAYLTKHSPESDLIPHTHIDEPASKFTRIERTRAPQIVSGERVYVEIGVRRKASSRATLDRPNFTVLQESDLSTASIALRIVSPGSLPHTLSLGPAAKARQRIEEIILVTIPVGTLRFGKKSIWLPNYLFA